MNISWKDNNWILREAAENFPLRVSSLGKYVGPAELPETDKSFFHVGERLHGDTDAGGGKSARKKEEVQRTPPFSGFRIHPMTVPSTAFKVMRKSPLSELSPRSTPSW